jgi:hypothetical protein
MTTGSMEQRLGRLEGAYEHLATKADLHQMESRLLRWLVGTILASVGMASGITIALNRLLNS